MASATRLCIFCRCTESRQQTCPLVNPWESVTPFPTEDAVLLEMLHKQPSALCQRCAEYDIIKVFQEAEPLDAIMQAQMSGTDYTEYCHQIGKYEMPLGPLSELHLTPSCQVCRLIYRIMPRGLLDPDDNRFKLVPFRSVIRITAWENLPPDIRSQSAIFLGLYAPNLTMDLGYALNPGGADIRLAGMTGEAIALNSSQTLPGRNLLNACPDSHERCRLTEWPAKMATTCMIDVISRKIVSCPDLCDYFALSYVWGGVIPADGALESGTLPRTIEDAITVTKSLGRQYLWVDALCIDQREDLTAEQAAAKQEQLNMMHLIYECATVTIVALSGKNSNCGIRGVSNESPRVYQCCEYIKGCEFFTVPPTPSAERDISVWDSRAWTFQEALISRRVLFLSENQASFDCWGFSVSDSNDADTDTPKVKPSGSFMDHIAKLMEFATGRSQQPESESPTYRPAPLHILNGMLSSYTRRHMTKEEDSLNAFLGILAMLERQLFPSDFIWGLPLQSHPQSLAWIHDRKCSPKRRLEFPSWSWAGWEGDVLIPEMVLELTSKRGHFDPRTDLMVRLIAVDGKKIVIEGWVVELEIRTEPFSEAFKLGSDEVIGSVMERNFLHNNTLQSGNYSCLVVQRTAYRITRDSREKQNVFLLLLDWNGQVATRKSIVTVTPFRGMDFMQAKPEKRLVSLE
ncbi:heterokaryon incompatibility protein-domain-containing protein [Xylogone sp. PMI_703]|nr:heterokaryon incompatibility protein-domain-containing protein [Xylogone sp. PMI_703]